MSCHPDSIELAWPVAAVSTHPDIPVNAFVRLDLAGDFPVFGVPLAEVCHFTAGIGETEHCVDTGDHCLQLEVCNTGLVYDINRKVLIHGVFPFRGLLSKITQKLYNSLLFGFCQAPKNILF